VPRSKNESREAATCAWPPPLPQDAGGHCISSLFFMGTILSTNQNKRALMRIQNSLIPVLWCILSDFEGFNCNT
jgi:hypothetical protein